MTEREMLYGLARLPFLTAARFDRLLRREGSVGAVYHLEEKSLRESGEAAEKQIGEWQAMRKNRDRLSEQYHKEKERGIKFITFLDGDYPARLRDIPGRPFALWVKGGLPEEGRPSVALIGSRACSAYGRAAAEKFGRELAQAGVQVISGAAAGVDGAGQRAALRAGGSSFGVLGCGVDVVYPQSNRELYAELARKGGLISEYPPERPPLPPQFPARNRIISGLGDCLVVTEAGEKSGTLITTDFALEQGKDIGAVPGRIGDRLSAGCNRLIQSGACLVSGTQDILDLLGGDLKFCVKFEKNPADGLADSEKRVYSCLGLLPKSLEEIVRETELLPSRAAGILLELELKGLAARTGVNEYKRKQV